MHAKRHYFFCSTYLANRNSVGFCLEINRAKNTTHANIKSRPACAQSVSYFDDAKNYRAVIAKRF